MESTNITLSYSKISLFKKCPTEFYYKYVIKDNSVETSWPGGVAGSAIHLGLEKYITALNEGMPLKQAEHFIDNSFEILFNEAKEEIKQDPKKVFKESKEFRLHKEDFFKGGNRALKAVLSFYNNYLYNRVSVEPEKEYKGLIKKINLTGIIDVKITDNDEIKIIDLKITGDGSNFWWIDWNQDIQSKMYDLLIYQNFKKVPVSFGYLVYDRTLNFLYFKERMKYNNILEETGHDLYLEDKIKEVERFIQKSLEDEEYGKSLSNPQEKECQWCSYSHKCKDKYQSEIIKQVRKIKV